MMVQMPETHDSLLLAIRDPANREAWQRFAQLYRPVIYRLARARGLQDADADDLAQQVLVAVSKAIPKWKKSDPKARFGHWLQRVVRNAILNAMTRGQDKAGIGGTGFLEAALRVPEEEASLDAQIELEYQRQVYRRAAEIVRGQIHEETWTMFALTVIDSETTENVAKRLGRTVGNVHAARSRVMRRLQAAVAELLEIES